MASRDRADETETEESPQRRGGGGGGEWAWTTAARWGRRGLLQDGGSQTTAGFTPHGSVTLF